MICFVVGGDAQSSGPELTTLCNLDPLMKVLILWKRKLSTYVMGPLERFSNQLVCTCKLTLKH
jgi:hypothetical protein